MTLQQLRYIVSIDRYRNFAKAAEALDITQPTLSSLLQKLEQELDVRIFERTIPEMHIPMLSEKQRDNVRRIDGDYLSQRRVSLYLRHDFIREKILNSIIQSLAVFIPGDMLDAGVRNKTLRL